MEQMAEATEVGRSGAAGQVEAVGRGGGSVEVAQAEMAAAVAVIATETSGAPVVQAIAAGMRGEILAMLRR